VGAAVLVTGPPGCGKTTLIKSVVAALSIRVGGFLTEEIRDAEERVGFRVVTLDGTTGLLAHVRTVRGPRVGRYQVDVEGFAAVGVAALERATREADLIVVDEIGKMELCCPAFLPALEAALASPKPLLGSILGSPHPVVDALKRRSEVELYRLSARNRQDLTEALLARLTTEVRA
jgi:nucleoside-triphosphatase THEP1